MLPLTQSLTSASYTLSLLRQMAWSPFSSLYYPQAWGLGSFSLPPSSYHRPQEARPALPKLGTGGPSISLNPQRESTAYDETSKPCSL